MQSNCREVSVTFYPNVVNLIELLRSSAEHDLGIPVSFDDVVNCVICSYVKFLVEGGGE